MKLFYVGSEVEAVSINAAEGGIRLRKIALPIKYDCVRSFLLPPDFEGAG